MTWASILAVAVGAGVGACARYLTHHFVTTRLRYDFPLATLLVNVIGCLILGFVVAVAARHAISPNVALLLGSGLCGGLTTFSTFSYESLDLTQRKKSGRAFGYVVLSVAAGLAAAAIGLTLGA
jgi:CrcB protein